MAVELLERVAAIEGAAKAAAAKSYRELLLRADAPLDGDAEVLAEVMTVLDRSAADLADDLTALAEAGRLEQLAGRIAEREEAAGKAVLEGDSFFRAEIARRQEAAATMARLQQAVASTAGRVLQAREAAGELARLKARHWQAFGLPAPTPPPEPPPPASPDLISGYRALARSLHAGRMALLLANDAAAEREYQRDIAAILKPGL